jgi:outer membrane protein assembly factor BamB
VLSRHFAAATAAFCLSLSTSVSNQSTGDWPQWRGPNRDGRSAETGLLTAWPANGPPLAWKAGGAGTGYSSISTAAGRLYTVGARGGTEYIHAFDVPTGRKLWEAANGSEYNNDRGNGPRSTPTIDGSRLYVLGASGDLTCLDAVSGKRVWSVNVLSTFGGSNPKWGLSESPLVLSDRVLVNAGGPGASVVALDKQNGKVIWKSESDDAGYSSAVVQRIGNTDQAVFFTASRAMGVDVKDGRRLWSYSRVANRIANIATPVVKDNFVFLSSDYGTGAALLKLDAAGSGVTATEVYFTQEMRNHHSSSILVGDHLYGFSSAILTALRFADGATAWKDRSVGKGSLVFADGHLYLFSEGGVVGLAEATPTGYREKGRFTIQQAGLPTWAHPIVSGGRLYLRDQDTIYAYDVRKR